MFDTWQGAVFDGRSVFAVVPPEAFLAGLGAVAAFLVGALLIACVARWRKRRGGPGKSEDDLETFHALYEQGQLSREELERIRARLAARQDPQPPENDD